jgi:tetratricopeptide (TPR) repeat protein
MYAVALTPRTFQRIGALSSRGVWTSQQDGLSVTAIETYPAVASKNPAVSTQCAQMLAQPPFQSLGSGSGRVHRALDTRGHIFEALGRREEAIADFRRALAKAPDLQGSKDALKRLGASP